MKTLTLPSLGLVATAALLAGCGGSVYVDGPSDSNPNPNTAEYSARLSRATSCPDLERKLKDNALSEMNAQLDQLAEQAKQPGFGQWYGEGDYANGGIGTSTGSGMEAGGPTAPSTDDSLGGPREHSETNTQVAGVDEADIVKTDGRTIYLIHGDKLIFLDANTPASLAIDSSVDIEGQPSEMFLTDDKIVVYSSVAGAEIYAAAGVTDPSSGSSGGGISSGSGGWETGAMPPDYYGGYYGPSLTKITVLTHEGATANVVKELYFEGSYLSSRRVDSHVRTVLSGGQRQLPLSYWPSVSPTTPEGWASAIAQLRQQNTTVIESSTMTDLLPRRFMKVNDSVKLLPPSCEDTYTPGQGTTNYGMTQVESIDLDHLSKLPAETTIVGAAGAVYSNEDAMYLAMPAYSASSVGGAGVAMDGPVMSSYETLTYLHKFNLEADPAKPQYTAFGSVKGQVKDQFSMDEREGVLRIATTSDSGWNDSSNSVYTLGQSGADLKQLGAIEGLAPTERIYSVRFVGDRGYVVTFRQVDPLFVIDLATPSAPKVLAELKIPGFSNYMHPIDDGDRLLTIGSEANEMGQVQGLALQVFDVRDAANPKLEHKYVFSDYEYSSSEAQYNAKAFTFYKDTLAIPFSGYKNDGNYGTTLQLFRVTGAEGITPLGAIDHSGFFNAETSYGYCGGYYGSEVRRGLFIEDNIYTVSYGGVTVNALSDLTTPIASVALPAPENNYGCMYY